jgi:hypothetical protein
MALLKCRAGSGVALGPMIAPGRERCGGLLTAFFAARRASAKSGWRCLIIGPMIAPDRAW